VTARAEGGAVDRGGGAVWLLAVGQTLVYAGSYYAFPALLPDLEAATGWSKTTLALGPSLAFLIMASLTVLTGRLVDRGLGGEMNRPGFTGGQNSRRIARYGTEIKEENREAVFT
jgi:hypothetical protein